MIKLEFELKKSGYFSINIEEKKYKSIELISNFDLTSERVAEDLEWTQRCIEGTFEEDGDDDFYVGFEGSPGIIYVKNNDRAYVEDAYDDEIEDYLVLSLEELKSVLQQMYDFLVSIGK